MGMIGGLFRGMGGEVKTLIPVIPHAIANFLKRQRRIGQKPHEEDGKSTNTLL